MSSNWSVKDTVYKWDTQYNYLKLSHYTVVLQCLCNNTYYFSMQRVSLITMPFRHCWYNCEWNISLHCNTVIIDSGLIYTRLYSQFITPCLTEGSSCTSPTNISNPRPWRFLKLVFYQCCEWGHNQYNCTHSTLIFRYLLAGRWTHLFLLWTPLLLLPVLLSHQGKPVSEMLFE